LTAWTLAPCSVARRDRRTSTPMPYLDKIDDPDVNRKNVLNNKNHRKALADKVGTCLLHDETDEARGLAVFHEFNKTWGSAEREYSFNPSKTGLDSRVFDLDLQRFG
jgi:hypothetical protein